MNNNTGMLNELGKRIFENAKSKGFYDDGKARNIGERLALIHSEISEALEADRKGRYFEHGQIAAIENRLLLADHLKNKSDNEFTAIYQSFVKGTHEEEIADIIIRALDHAAFLGIDIDLHVEAKMRMNSLREPMHGKKY